MKRPNVVFVFPDQLGALWTGAYGHPLVETPHLDALAREGTRFERAYTVAPLCTPARAALMTGRYPRQTGVTRLGQALPRGQPTLADHFNKAGYATSYVGKWHLAGPPHANRQVLPPERGGWQRFLGWDSHHVDHWRGSIWDNDDPAPQSLHGHETDGLFDRAQNELRRLSQNAAEQPFFLFVAPQAPHPPCTPPPAFEALYRGRADLARRPNYEPNARFVNRAWNCDMDAPTFVERYFGEITHLDAALGRLLQTLDDCGRRDDTLVVFTSDHGEMAGCHGLFGKQVMWEEATRVPAVVRLPGGPRDNVSDALHATVDWLPTLLELCGLPPSPHAAGISYAPLLRGENQPETRAFVPIQEQDTLLALVRGTAKLVVDAPSGTPLGLYDLAADPFETVNRLDAPDAAARTLSAELLGELQRWRADILTEQT